MGIKRNSKLTPADVLSMRERYARGDITQRELSDQYGLTTTQVGRILRGEVWKDVAMSVATPAQLDESLKRLIRVQAQVRGEVPPADVLPGNTSALDKMRQDATAERRKNADAMLDELTGDEANGKPDSEAKP